MLIRTLRPCAVRGRECRAHACLDLPEEEAQALLAAGDAEPWVPGQPPAQELAQEPVGAPLALPALPDPTVADDGHAAPQE